MKRISLYRIVTFFLLSSILFTPQVVTAQGNSDNITIENENLSVRITANQNVPKYEFWEPGENSTVYRVQFVSMFEAEDDGEDLQYNSGRDSKVSTSQQSLSSWSWVFSDVLESEGDTTFNMTGSPSGGDLEVVFVNHIGGGSSSFKFDIIINNYEFVSDTAMLVFAFRLISAGGNDNAEQNENTTEFGDGYMEVEETATAGENSVGVGLTTTANGTNTAYISYEHFSGDLVHDPILGINSFPVLEVIIGGLILIALIAVIVYFIKKE